MREHTLERRTLINNSENGASVTNIIIDIPNCITGEPYKIQQRFLWGSAKLQKKFSQISWFKRFWHSYKNY